MTNKPLSFLGLLNRLPKTAIIDVMYKDGLFIRHLVVIGKTVEWVLQQSAFSSVFQLMGEEVDTYEENSNGRFSIILK